jgi:hypothetical protein
LVNLQFAAKQATQFFQAWTVGDILAQGIALEID